MVKWRREKRLTEYPLPEALEVSFKRAQQMSRGEQLVWAETMAINIDRLVASHKESHSPDAVWDAYHYALQLVGVTRALVDDAAKLEL